MLSVGCPTDQKYSSYSIDESVKNLKTIINASSTNPYTQLCLHNVKKLFIIKRSHKKNHKLQEHLMY